MSTSDEWSIVFYIEKPSNRRPVNEFLRSLDDRTRSRIGNAIERLRQLNVQARYPLARPVGGNLWELRDEVDTTIYRLFYFFHTGKNIVFMHGFQKKTQKTPQREIDLARQRMQRFLAEEDR